MRDPREIFPAAPDQGPVSLLNTPEFLLDKTEELLKEEKEDADADAEYPLSPLLNVEVEDCLAMLESL